MPSNHIDFIVFFLYVFVFKATSLGDFDRDLEGEQPLSKWVLGGPSHLVSS